MLFFLLCQTNIDIGILACPIKHEIPKMLVTQRSFLCKISGLFAPT